MFNFDIIPDVILRSTSTSLSTGSATKDPNILPLNPPESPFTKGERTFRSYAFSTRETVNINEIGKCKLEVGKCKMKKLNNKPTLKSKISNLQSAITKLGEL